MFSSEPWTTFFWMSPKIYTYEAVFAGAILHPDPGRCHCHCWPFGCRGDSVGVCPAVRFGAPTSTVPLGGPFGRACWLWCWLKFFANVPPWVYVTSDLFVDAWKMERLWKPWNLCISKWHIIFIFAVMQVISLTSHTLMSRVGVLWDPTPICTYYGFFMFLSPPIFWGACLLWSWPNLSLRSGSAGEFEDTFGGRMEETLAVSAGDVVMWCWFRKKHNNNSYIFLHVWPTKGEDSYGFI